MEEKYKKALEALFILAEEGLITHSRISELLQVPYQEVYRDREAFYEKWNQENKNKCL